MSSAGGVRAGKAYVEITADDTPFQRKIKTLGSTLAGRFKGIANTTGLSALSSAIGAVGAAAMPVVGAVAAVGAAALGAGRAAQTFEDQLNELKGSVADLTPGQMEAVRDEAMRLSKSLRVGPAEAAAALTLLIKAGMSVEDALNGAAEAAVQFAKVSGVDAAQAAEFMKVAMNVFGLSAKDAVDTLSAAADSSETSIASMVEGFSQIGGVAKGTNQSLFGLSQAMAVLARYGIRGEEAGTGLKTMLTKLIAPTDEAKQALATMGLSMESFVDASGKLLPMSQIAAIFAKQMKGMSGSAREAMLSNEALVKVFDVRGIKIIQAFADAGVEGFDKIATAMEGAKSVSEKYADRLSGLMGSISGIYHAVERFVVVVGEALAPAFKLLHDNIVPVFNILSGIIGLIPKAYRLVANLGKKLYDSLPDAVKSLYNGVASITAPITGFLWGDERAEENKIKRDAEGKAMAEAGSAPALTAPGKSAEASRDVIGTFNGSVLGQLGVGPALAAAQATADNTARIADAMDKVKIATANAANTAGVGETVRGGSPAKTGGNVASVEKEMLSASERTALGVEKLVAMMRESRSILKPGVVTYS